jgi:hypothetical protein
VLRRDHLNDQYFAIDRRLNIDHLDKQHGPINDPTVAPVYDRRLEFRRSHSGATNHPTIGQMRR